jgi:hypothetical protein
MNSTTNLPLLASFQILVSFREQIYLCFLKAKDALMNTADALLTENQAQSLPELSLSHCFTRKWHSIYQAFQHGKIDRDKLRQTFVQGIKNIFPSHATRLYLGTDVSSIAKPKSQTARDRTLVHESNLPDGCPPVVAGWQFSTLAVLPSSPSSWTYTLDNTRIKSDQKTAEVAAQQLRQVITLLDNPTDLPPLLVADGYYCCLGFLLKTQDIDCDKLVRLSKNRLLYRAAPERTGNVGRPKEHGSVFKPDDARTHSEPDELFERENLEVACWKNLHLKEFPQQDLTVIRVTRGLAKNNKRDPRVSWFLFVGKVLPPLEEIPALYANRYSLEHGYRVDKQDLLWESVRVRTPEQFECFTDMIACIRNQLCFAKNLGSVRQDWERPSLNATPSQVRRYLKSIMWQLGTPASVSQPRGNSPGRAKGTKISPATRYEVIRKSPKPPKKEAKLV